MTKRKAKRFASLALVFCTLALLLASFAAPAYAETANTVTATTSEAVTQGNTGYLYVYIDSTEELASLDVSVHFDSTKITVQSVYNGVSDVMYDKSVTYSSVRFTYLFAGDGAATKTRLFYFSYKIAADAEIGDTYFDIVINEALDANLQTANVSGSRCKLTVSEKVVSKTASVYGTSAISTAVEQEFTLSYRFSTYQIASGAVQITYDPELFEIVSVTNDKMLSNKVVDVNTSLAGTVYVSFVGTAYYSNTNFLSVTLRTLENVTESSDIKLTVTELYDLDLNSISCSGYKTTASVVFDEAYTADAPQMTVSATYSDDTEQVTATIKLDKDSCLGAGDFVLGFDTDVLTYSIYKKGFSPSFFNVNDKEAEDGILKFSIISLSDIMAEEMVITVVFDVKHACAVQTTALELTGSGLVDSMTNTILLNFIDASVNVPLKHTYEAVVTNPTCTQEGYTTHTCKCGDSYVTDEQGALGHIDDNADHSCDRNCGKTDVGDHTDGNDLDHICDYGCGQIADDGCYDVSPKDHVCDECGAANVGTHADGNDANHTCDYCDGAVEGDICVDIAPKDHVCDECGAANMGTHADGNDTNHLCDYGCGQVADDGCHGGTATCVAQAVCSECNTAYGPFDVHDYGDLIEATEAVHTQTELKGAVAPHYFCDVCGKYFTQAKLETTLEALTDEAPVHTPNADDGDCTTDITCSVCEKIIISANASHTGGTATCENKAICTVCGKEYGDPNGHSYFVEWSKNDTHHWHECNCGDKTDKVEHSYGEWTVTKEATATEKGSKTKTCVCGHSITEEIPSTGAQGGNENEGNNGEGSTDSTDGMPASDSNDNKDGLSGGAVVGIVVGSVIVSFGGLSLYWFVIRKKK